MSERAMPFQRRLYMDGDQWCAVGPGFRNLAIDPAGFGGTPAAAVTALNAARDEAAEVDEFEVGGFCRLCKAWVPVDESVVMCCEPDCPCIG